MNQEIQKNSEILLKKLASLSEDELAKLVIFHNEKYFLQNAPEITDEAFDKLVEALKFRNPSSKALLEIGFKEPLDIGFGKEVKHKRPMLSLDKCYDDQTFSKWAEKINGDFIAMPKIDGVASSIIYQTDGTILVATRGDGKSGEDITKNALFISDLPKTLPKRFDHDLEVRGEIFLPLSRFNEYFANDFSSPRNLAAGFLKLKNADLSKLKHLKFFPYDVRGASTETEEEKFRLLETLGFSMMPWFMAKNDLNAILVYQQLLKDRETFDYEIDGVVFRANSLDDQMRLGETSHHPKYAIAYKFHGESAPTKLIDIEWSVARSGIITPVAIVEPVFVSGASISRASLHNVGIFLKLDLREQSLVEINRRGGVIPHLERVLSRSGTPWPLPTACPSCGSKVVMIDDFLHCQNKDACEEVVVSKLIHFCHVVGIEGLGQKIIRKLFLEGMLKNFGDVFRLKASKLMELERMGETLAHKLVDEINSKKNIDLKTFLQALGLNEVGNNVSELIASNFHTLEKIRALTVEDLLPIHGIGESIANSLVKGLKEISAEIDDLLTEVTIKDEVATVSDSSHPLFGKSVIFTGKMAHLDRKAAQAAVKSLGGKTPGAISSNTDILVIGDEGSPLLGNGQKSTKQKEAEKLQSLGSAIRIISESEFLTLIK